MRDTTEYVEVKRSEFYGVCAEIVTNTILANIKRKYGKEE